MPTDQELEYQRADREVHEAFNALRRIEGKAPIPYRELDPSIVAEAPFCSFCGKGANQVRKLVGGNNAFICDECIVLASEIIAGD